MRSGMWSSSSSPGKTRSRSIATRAAMRSSQRVVSSARADRSRAARAPASGQSLARSLYSYAGTLPAGQRATRSAGTGPDRLGGQRRTTLRHGLPVAGHRTAFPIRVQLASERNRLLRSVRSQGQCLLYGTQLSRIELRRRWRIADLLERFLEALLDSAKLRTEPVGCALGRRPYALCCTPFGRWLTTRIDRALGPSRRLGDRLCTVLRQLVIIEGLPIRRDGCEPALLDVRLEDEPPAAKRFRKAMVAAARVAAALREEYSPLDSRRIAELSHYSSSQVAGSLFTADSTHRIS